MNHDGNMIDSIIKKSGRGRPVSNPKQHMTRTCLKLIFLLIFITACMEVQASLFDKRKLKASRGDVDAQLSVALMYASGEGVSKDIKEAAKWFRAAAEQGNVLAQFNLGEMYAKGNGLPQNYHEAAAWYLKAAEQGNVAAKFNLGLMYGNGQGVRYDPNKAEKWLTEAAEQGDAKMQFALGKMYARGVEVPYDAKNAEKWLREAAGQGDANMQFFVGQLYRDLGELVVQDREEAASWFHKAAEQGHAMAKLNLGVMYLNGEGIQVDMVQAYKWLYLAAISGNEEALRKIRTAETIMSQKQIKEAQVLATDWLSQHK